MQRAHTLTITLPEASAYGSASGLRGRHTRVNAIACLKPTFTGTIMRPTPVVRRSQIVGCSTPEEVKAIDYQLSAGEYQWTGI
jgi:hypothetical protein